MINKTFPPIHIRYWIYRSWGRIGTTIGDEKEDIYFDLQLAVKKFHNLFREKTKNNFTAPSFKKHPGKYYLFSNAKEDRQNVLRSIQSDRLPESVQDLLKLFINNDMMDKVLIMFKMDVTITPLAMISEVKLNEAFTVLKEINEKIVSASKEELTEASNRFHSFIPYGVTNEDIIDCKDKLQERADLLQSIFAMKFNCNFFNGITLLESDNFLDEMYSRYEKKGILIKPVSCDSEKFKIIEMNVQDTKESLNLEIKNIFEIQRKDDDDAHYETFKDLPNRRFLWHGSRLINFPSILSDGLRIMSKHDNGCTFGEGIYFADVFANAAYYCRYNETENIGLLLLCEVALGESRLHYEPMTDEPTYQTQSVLAIGKKTMEFNTSFSVLDGVDIPTGRPMKREDETMLAYDEFIVYNERQVKIKYLVVAKINPFQTYCF